jgi:hypothetical protein
MMQYAAIEEQYMKISSIVLGGKSIPIVYRNINEFIDIAGKIDIKDNNIKIDTYKLISMLGIPVREATEIVMKATDEDIAMINYLDIAWFSTIKPIEIMCPNYPKERGTVAAVNLSATDIFLGIIQANRITQDKIVFS